jgi:hypothetical protein
VEKEMNKKQFRDFQSAREFVRKLNLNGQKEWEKYSKSGKRPDDIPSTPSKSYKNKGWKSWGDFLGTGNVSSQLKEHVSFDQAREFARSLGLTNWKEWQKYCVSGNKPDDIPSSPNRNYKNKGWVNLSDFLGTKNILGHNKEHMSFDQAREFAQSLGLKNRIEWRKYCASGNKPANIPFKPEKIYKNKGWRGLSDFLGTGRYYVTKQYRSFESARKFARLLNLKSGKKWQQYTKSGNKPGDIPANPAGHYKNEFKGMGDWLGTGTVAHKDKVYRSFTKAKEFVRSLGLNNRTEWLEYCKSGNKPKDIPAQAVGHYKKDWKGWGDFLGTGNIVPKDRVYRPYKEARDFVRSLGLKGLMAWREYCKSGNKPNDIPSSPWNVYKEWNKK